MKSESSAASELPASSSTRAEAFGSPGKVLPFPPPARQLAQRRSRTWLLCEFLILFVAVPVALYFHVGGPIPLLPALWGISAGALLLLLRDRSFDRRQLWNAKPLGRQWPQMLGLFAAGVVVITVLVVEYRRPLFLGLLRHHTRLWASIMITYPFASVYPQSILFRAFFFHRYEPLLQPDPEAHPWRLILASAAAFAFVHILFHNWIAVGLTFIGGILFAVRYLESRSLCVSFVEHTLYGWLLFTIGLGQFFISGTV